MECCICCENIDNLDKILKLECSCKYIYHKDCIEQWFNTNLNCPLCRKNIKKDNLKEEEYNKSLEKQEWVPYIYVSIKTYPTEYVSTEAYPTGTINMSNLNSIFLNDFIINL